MTEINSIAAVWCLFRATVTDRLYSIILSESVTTTRDVGHGRVASNKKGSARQAWASGRKDETEFHRLREESLEAGETGELRLQSAALWPALE